MTDADQLATAMRAHVSDAIAKLWWLPLVRGIVLVILGCYALFTPGMTIAALTQVIGIFVIAEGILAVIAGVLGKTPSRLWTIVRGVLAILIGIFVFGHSALVAGVTATTVMYILAFAAIVLGILEIVAAIQDRKEIEGEGWLILGGVLMVIFGVLLLIAPLAFGLMLVRVLGVYAIIYGISHIVLAFRARSFGKQLKG